MKYVIDISEKVLKTRHYDDFFDCGSTTLTTTLDRGKPLDSVLDEIRAEFISLYPKNYAGEPELGGLSCVFSLDKVFEIIDKYKAESEDNG